ncbi:FAD-dependent oxidoreductase [Melaminivora jejuensis]|uniref:NAD(P)/FAD-dependent oxidoreductase n=1 Tax=Melaminivora jejuensis TaxID=1267217 RepID=UPI001AE0219E|nr:FAD-dependent oxidoreductase [Melaminivora jejuensis]UHJ65715.1 FAD-dependent oxidoreductase [Melaminivora jejuensis]
MKVAIIGSGISGLAAAHRLRGQARVTLLEAGSYFGGHTHTVDVCLPDARNQFVTHGVDTGFLVFNERTYPGLIALLAELGIPTAHSDMSFSVRVPGAGVLGAAALEWSGSSLATVFAQRRNLLRPRFAGMLAALLRFNRLCTALAETGQEQALAQPLGDFLQQHRFSAAFRDWYLLPMLGCIWSCPTDQMLRFPIATLVRFCHNHGLIQVHDRPRWHTVAGGARQYVQAIVSGLDARLNTPVRCIERSAAGVLVRTDHGAEYFNAVVLAVHSDQALRLLAQPSAAEQQLLGAIRYQPNRAVLHIDSRVMPQRRAAWAAWNYERAADDARESARVCLHYWLNRLQPLPFAHPVLVSLNPVSPIDPACVLGEYDYEHPVFDLAALAAQRQLHQLQGVQHTWYAGAWMGYGFHEDGLQSGWRAADALLAQHQHREAA